MSRKYPEKIYLETTTRCNLRCPMCVKFAPGSRIEEMDLDPAAFERLIPVLPHVRRLILNGIGEPLLHPQLDAFIARARAHLPTDGSIALQSNGVLIDRERAERLLHAGLDTICLSLDSLAEPTPFPGPATEHSITAVTRAIDHVNRVRGTINPSFRTGLETVVSLENFRELPDIVQWAGDKGVDFIIVTHLLHYTPSSSDVFNPNTSAAIALYRQYRKRAAALNLDLTDCLNVYRSFDRTPAALAALDLLNTMHKEAAGQDIRLHLAGLIDHEHRIERDMVAAAFTETEEIAGKRGLELYLPPLETLVQRRCPFVEEKAVCIGVNGDIMPCHFLWHSYTCRALGKEIVVEPRVFGSLTKQDLSDIWHNENYRHFRHEAGAYDYAHCWSCPQGPCPNLVNDEDSFANDCYGSIVPCGHCQWSLGGIRCL